MKDQTLSIITTTIISGAVSFSVSWLMLTISNKKNSKIKLKDNISDHCSEIQRIVCRKNPGLDESDVLYCVTDMIQLLESSKIISEADKENLLGNISKIKYQFVSLTRDDLDNSEIEKFKGRIDGTFLEIKYNLERI